jgi:hypothetical protein
MSSKKNNNDGAPVGLMVITVGIVLAVAAMGGEGQPATESVSAESRKVEVVEVIEHETEMTLEDGTKFTAVEVEHVSRGTIEIPDNAMIDDDSFVPDNANFGATER